MNPQRLGAALIGGGAVLGVGAVLALGAGAAGLELPSIPRPAVAAPAGPAPVAGPIEPDEPDTVASGELDPALVRGGIDPTGVPLAYLESLLVNPALDPGSNEYLPPAARAELMAVEHLKAECMAEKGFTYYPSASWLGQYPAAEGMSYAEKTAWLDALQGQIAPNADGSAPHWTQQGCAGLADHERMTAIERGDPLSAPFPDPDPSEPTPAQAFFAYEQAVERCMEESGFTYLMPWEWEPGAEAMRSDPETTWLDHPQMPSSLDEAQRAAWNERYWGDPLPAPAYRWQDAGCSGYATHVTGNDDRN